ncbi:hypothetical protein HYN56_15575 [Flavobacterium crocinum]|uniref:Uncharacterized protein n=1 Tax=Flavobacterium crocinum TaxID=2183896 RepID=A0A2S1YNC1_9FLAO|nr:hypothetical protein HYN56_15575 [Flavobacterium crocinum]
MIVLKKLVIAFLNVVKIVIKNLTLGNCLIFKRLCFVFKADEKLNIGECVFQFIFVYYFLMLI